MTIFRVLLFYFEDISSTGFRDDLAAERPGSPAAILIAKHMDSPGNSPCRAYSTVR